MTTRIVSPGRALERPARSLAPLGPSVASLGIVLRHCLYCGQPFSQGGELRHLRFGVRVAFDPDRGRIWTVCEVCHGWNLWLLEDRLDALEELERTAGSRARLLYQTHNVALLETAGLELIRVGRAALPEEAWWRYGRELRRRRDRYRSRLSMVGTATYAAVSYVGANFGLSRITGKFDLQADLHTDVMRWRMFGRTAWSGRVPCPWCQSVLIKLFFFNSRSLILLPGRNQGLAIGMPCTRCDPWTDDRVHRFDGPAAEHVLRRVLAYQNIRGSSQEELEDAVTTIEACGSAQELIDRLATERIPLYELARTRSLALEMSVNESAERRQLATEGAAIEASWRRAEDLAAIIDEEL